MYYLTHPQVEIEPARPVPEWRLSPLGRRRVESILEKSWLRAVGRIVASAEMKAVETAAIIAAHLRVPVEIVPEMGENDRSSTGFLEPPEFEAAADRFFAEPDRSWQGWERAVDAAGRIEQAVDNVLGNENSTVSTLLVGHGGVGTLLKCRIAGRPIGRDEDQVQGGGSIFAFDFAARRLAKLFCDWTRMEDFEGVDDEA